MLLEPALARLAVGDEVIVAADQHETIEDAHLRARRSRGWGAPAVGVGLAQPEERLGIGEVVLAERAADGKAAAVDVERDRGVAVAGHDLRALPGIARAELELGAG